MIIPRKHGPAGIQYFGEPGSSQECLDAIIRLIQYGDQLKQARILSDSDKHCFLFTIEPGDFIAIKSGFTSGYPGEGPRVFSYALQLLKAHEIAIEEYKVGTSLVERLDNSALTKVDIKNIEEMLPIRPKRLFEYIAEKDHMRIHNGTVWQEFRPVIPFAIIDGRIADIAISFWKNPDGNLLTGYKRLEDTIRRRTNLQEHGSKLFSGAFLKEPVKLIWKEIIDEGEKIGRANLFINAFSAHRNPRAHQEKRWDDKNLLSEFLLLNHLFILENQASESSFNGDYLEKPGL